MVDTISESDVDRMDQHVDPTALNKQQIEQAFRSGSSEQDGSSLNQTVKGDAREAFSRKLAAKKAPEREAASAQLASKISEPGANNQRQLYGKNPETGRNTFVGTAQNIEVDVGRDGTVYGVNQNTGTRAIVGQINL